jgi:hypothetical protein
VIREVYGEPVRSDFDNISSMCSFFTPKQNVLWKLLQDKGIIEKKKKNRKSVPTDRLDFSSWSKRHT